mmetsp:Transcript_110387/g.307544  ORF Transcript_110387/g.307544 Transcript_110387/m.307544 type:complete len:385 (-) Transcript_110387:529-1683(-)
MMTHCLTHLLHKCEEPAWQRDHTPSARLDRAKHWKLGSVQRQGQAKQYHHGQALHHCRDEPMLVNIVENIADKGPAFSIVKDRAIGCVQHSDEETCGLVDVWHEALLGADGAACNAPAPLALRGLGCQSAQEIGFLRPAVLASNYDNHLAVVDACAQHLLRLPIHPANQGPGPEHRPKDVHGGVAGYAHELLEEIPVFEVVLQDPFIFGLQEALCNKSDVHRVASFDKGKHLLRRLVLVFPPLCPARARALFEEVCRCSQQHLGDDHVSLIYGIVQRGQAVDVPGVDVGLPVDQGVRNPHVAQLGRQVQGRPPRDPLAILAPFPGAGDRPACHLDMRMHGAHDALPGGELQLPIEAPGAEVAVQQSALLLENARPLAVGSDNKL